MKKHLGISFFGVFYTNITKILQQYYIYTTFMKNIEKNKKM